MKENEFYHGLIYPGMRSFIRNQFHIGGTIEISDITANGKTLKGFKKIKILEKYRNFLVAVVIDPTPSGRHVRECYTYTDLVTVMYARPYIVV